VRNFYNSIIWSPCSFFFTPYHLAAASMFLFMIDNIKEEVALEVEGSILQSSSLPPVSVEDHVHLPSDGGESRDGAFMAWLS
jgi:hypothetical protein